MVRTILIVAAEPRELSGVVARCARTASFRARVRFARSGELNGYRLVMVANGPGWDLAREAASVPVEAAAIVSSGYCGAVNPAYASGEIFVATEVDSLSCCIPEAGRPHRKGTLTTVDGVVSDKRGMKADAVDMEAGAVAEVALERETPFYCIRAVLDTAEEGFALDFNRLRGRDGRFSRPRILAAALKQPAEGIPELLRLVRRGRVCSRALGDFIADCRF